MKRIKVIGWINIDRLPFEKIDLSQPSGLTEQAHWAYTEGFDTLPSGLLEDVWFKLENDDPMRTVPAHEVVEGDMVFEGDVTYTVQATKWIKGIANRVHLQMTSNGQHAIWHSYDPNEPIDICRRTETD